MKNGLTKVNLNLKDSESGFTLIEMVVAIFGFALIAVGLIALVSNVFLSSSRQNLLLSDVDQTRKAAFQLIKELRNASSSDNGAYALDTAGAQQLIFYSNADKQSDTERIRYFVQNNQLWKGVVDPVGSPAVYNLGSEKTSLIQNDLANGANPVFLYYDGNYAGTSTQAALPQPVNVTAVKFIQVSLQVYNKAGVTNATTYTVTAGGSIRNLKTNLGN